ncbi:MAG: hypothetical protein U9Q67_00120 [Patescibacteria group bacterium]|nr:hypothetical protein [Patescibacteria group bacterium]
MESQATIQPPGKTSLTGEPKDHGMTEAPNPTTPNPTNSGAEVSQPEEEFTARTFTDEADGTEIKVARREDGFIEITQTDVNKPKNNIRKDFPPRVTIEDLLTSLEDAIRKGDGSANLDSQALSRRLEPARFGKKRSKRRKKPRSPLARLALIVKLLDKLQDAESGVEPTPEPAEEQLTHGKDFEKVYAKIAKQNPKLPADEVYLRALGESGASQDLIDTFTIHLLDYSDFLKEFQSARPTTEARPDEQTPFRIRFDRAYTRIKEEEKKKGSKLIAPDIYLMALRESGTPEDIIATFANHVQELHKAYLERLRAKEGEDQFQHTIPLEMPNFSNKQAIPAIITGYNNQVAEPKPRLEVNTRKHHINVYDETERDKLVARIIYSGTETSVQTDDPNAATAAITEVTSMMKDHYRSAIAVRERILEPALLALEAYDPSQERNNVITGGTMNNLEGPPAAPATGKIVPPTEVEEPTGKVEEPATPPVVETLTPAEILLQIYTEHAKDSDFTDADAFIELRRRQGADQAEIEMLTQLKRYLELADSEPTEVLAPPEDGTLDQLEAIQQKLDLLLDREVPVSREVVREICEGLRTSVEGLVTTLPEGSTGAESLRELQTTLEDHLSRLQDGDEALDGNLQELTDTINLMKTAYEEALARDEREAEQAAAYPLGPAAPGTGTAQLNEQTAPGERPAVAATEHLTEADVARMIDERLDTGLTRIEEILEEHLVAPPIEPAPAVPSTEILALQARIVELETQIAQLTSALSESREEIQPGSLEARHEAVEHDITNIDNIQRILSDILTEQLGIPHPDGQPRYYRAEELAQMNALQLYRALTNALAEIPPDDRAQVVQLLNRLEDFLRQEFDQDNITTITEDEGPSVRIEDFQNHLQNEQAELILQSQELQNRIQSERDSRLLDERREELEGMTPEQLRERLTELDEIIEQLERLETLHNHGQMLIDLIEHPEALGELLENGAIPEDGITLEALATALEALGDDLPENFPITAEQLAELIPYLHETAENNPNLRLYPTPEESRPDGDGNPTNIVLILNNQVINIDQELRSRGETGRLNEYIAEREAIRAELLRQGEELPSPELALDAEVADVVIEELTKKLETKEEPVKWWKRLCKHVAEILTSVGGGILVKAVVTAGIVGFLGVTGVMAAPVAILVAGLAGAAGGAVCGGLFSGCLRYKVFNRKKSALHVEHAKPAGRTSPFKKMIQERLTKKYELSDRLSRLTEIYSKLSSLTKEQVAEMTPAQLQELGLSADEIKDALEELLVLKELTNFVGMEYVEGVEFKKDDEDVPTNDALKHLLDIMPTAAGRAGISRENLAEITQKAGTTAEALYNDAYSMVWKVKAFKGGVVGFVAGAALETAHQLAMVKDAADAAGATTTTAGHSPTAMTQYNEGVEKLAEQTANEQMGTIQGVLNEAGSNANAKPIFLALDTDGNGVLSAAEAAGLQEELTNRGIGMAETVGTLAPEAPEFGEYGTGPTSGWTAETAREELGFRWDPNAARHGVLFDETGPPAMAANERAWDALSDAGVTDQALGSDDGMRAFAHVLRGGTAEQAIEQFGLEVVHEVPGLADGIVGTAVDTLGQSGDTFVQSGNTLLRSLTETAITEIQPTTLAETVDQGLLQTVTRRLAVGVDTTMAKLTAAAMVAGGGLLHLQGAPDGAPLTTSQPPRATGDGEENDAEDETDTGEGAEDITGTQPPETDTGDETGTTGGTPGTGQADRDGPGAPTGQPGRSTAETGTGDVQVLGDAGGPRSIRREPGTTVGDAPVIEATTTAIGAAEHELNQTERDLRPREFSKTLGNVKLTVGLLDSGGVRILRIDETEEEDRWKHAQWKLDNSTTTDLITELDQLLLAHEAIQNRNGNPNRLGTRFRAGRASSILPLAELIQLRFLLERLQISEQAAASDLGPTPPVGNTPDVADPPVIEPAPPVPPLAIGESEGTEQADTSIVHEYKGEVDGVPITVSRRADGKIQILREKTGVSQDRPISNVYPTGTTTTYLMQQLRQILTDSDRTNPIFKDVFRNHPADEPMPSEEILSIITLLLQLKEQEAVTESAPPQEHFHGNRISLALDMETGLPDTAIIIGSKSDEAEFVTNVAKVHGEDATVLEEHATIKLTMGAFRIFSTIAARNSHAVTRIEPPGKNPIDIPGERGIVIEEGAIIILGNERLRVVNLDVTNGTMVLQQK